MEQRLVCEVEGERTGPEAERVMSAGGAALCRSILPLSCGLLKSKAGER
jgi:hypothetical protein